MIKHRPLAVLAAMFVACQPARADSFDVDGSAGSSVTVETIASFDQPWAMTFLPDGRLLVTTRPGKLFLVSADGSKQEVANPPRVSYGGQGGLGDVVLHPEYAQNQLVYFSYVEPDASGSKRGAVVARAIFDPAKPALGKHEIVWKQTPKTTGRGHYSHRIAFGPAGSPEAGMLFITSGDRQKQTPAQDFNGNLGKVIRLNDDGSVPPDNPWQDKGELAKTFWSTGHRNLLGIDFDADGRLWTHEMGPRHGDELNLIVKGDNYGWPIVSNGDHYSGRPIPDHDTRPEFNPPEAYWVPSIAPSGLSIYKGDMFPDWKNDAFIGGLASQALIRVDIEGNTAREAERFEWGERIREVETGPTGALWLLEDGGAGRLLKLTPAK